MGNLSVSEGDCGIESPTTLWASLVAQTVTGSEDLGSIPVSGRSLGERKATHSDILAWESSWTEETGGLQSMGSQKIWTLLSD